LSFGEVGIFIWDSYAATKDAVFSLAEAACLKAYPDTKLVRMRII
jgi:hypothetical protein